MTPFPRRDLRITPSRRLEVLVDLKELALSHKIETLYAVVKLVSLVEQLKTLISFLCSLGSWIFLYNMNSELRKQQRTNIKKNTNSSNWYNKKRKDKKRNDVKQLRSLNKHLFKNLSEQSGIEVMNAMQLGLDTIAKFAGVDVPDNICREVEGLVLLLSNLSQQTTALGVTSSVLLYLQGRTTKSILGIVKDYMDEIFVSSQDSGTPDWLLCLRDMRDNWTLCVHNRAFKQVSKLLGLLVIMGLCDASNCTFSLGQFRIFQPDLMEKHSNALDLADAIFETIMFFTEGMYLCFQTGSIKPLLVNDRTALELDAEYATIIGWWDLVKNGNLKKFADMEDHEFEGRLNMLSTNLRNISQTLKGLDKKLVMDKYQKIVQIQNDYITKKISSGLRHAPFGLEFFGDSSQGKSMCSDQIVDVLLASQGLSTDKRLRCAYNPGDKFISNWTSDKLVMVFDDVANETSNFVERPPTRAIIDVINNQMFYAPKAEIDAKGKCFVEPWIAVVTTNKKDLDAGTYSNCPYSIQRRTICITVKAKEEFQRMEDGIPCGVNSTKVRQYYTDENGVYHPPQFDDIWMLTVERAVKPQKLTTVAPYAPVSYNGEEMVDVPMATVINYLIEEFDAHRNDQQCIVEGMNERNVNLEFCSHEGCKFLAETCPHHGVQEPHFGIETALTAYSIWSGWKSHISKLFRLGVMHDLDSRAAEYVYEYGNKFLDDNHWIQLVPRMALDNNYFKEFLTIVYKDDLAFNHRNASRFTWFMTILVMIIFFAFPYGFIGSFIALIYGFWCQQDLYNRIEEELFQELKDKNMKVHPMVKRYRDGYAHTICKAAVGIAALYAIARAYRAFVATRPIQGSLEPKTQEEIDERDSEVNVWAQQVKRDLPSTHLLKTTSIDQLQGMIEKNLTYVSIHLDDGQNARSNALFLKSNIVVIPDHYFIKYGENLNCTFRKKNPEASGGKFAARIHSKSSYLIPNTDLRICYCPNGGSFKDISKYFPTDDLPSFPFRMVYRAKDGLVTLAKGVTEPGNPTTFRTFSGGYYRNLSINTFGGLCGATVISESKVPMVLGFHLGGTENTPIGCYGSLLQKDIDIAIKAIKSIEGVLITGEAGTFREKVLDVQMCLDNDLHKKSPLNFLPNDSQVEYLGSVVGRSTFQTAVKVTPISEHVTDVCGSPNIYQGPKMNPDWYGWQACLENLAVPAHPYPHDLLEIAVKDYKEDLLPLFKSDLWRNARPLTDKENLCGIVGKKFMDQIKLNTSVGYPLTGPKRNFVTELESTEENPNNRELDPVLMDEITYCEDCYRRGERAYPIAKACKKDEILSKPKCRIFYGNALSLTWLIRKRFLPILRILQMNPLQAECAVGINCHGPEWQQFHDHATKFGMDRLIGGDYGKYDQKLPAQLILAALRILIDFAKQCDYTEEDINIMETMCGDIVYAYIAFNGDLIGLTEGTHISGNSLTVIINGICGSLNLRAAFYTFYPCSDFDNRMKFREWVALMTYGDDNIGSTKPGCDKFNIKSISDFLAKYGQVYTMPDKESELVPFLPPEEFEFLKRFSVYHPKLGVHVGALLDKSIYKSLHAFMRPRGCMDTEEEACAMNIDGALREWFNHGEEKYEKQRALLMEVAKRAGISHICTQLNVTYNDRVSNWNEQYNSS